MTETAGTEIPLRVRIADGHHVPEYPEECERHTPQPRGYLQWHEWAEKMDKTHTQRQCLGCGLWAIWEPRE
jgi:hypothetical protein